MRKLTLAIAAVVIGLAMTSCGGESPKESIMKATDEFFAQAEKDVQAITSGEEFMNFFANFANEKDNFTVKTFSPYADKDGNITGISESDMEEIQSYIYDRASAYNAVEAAKITEFVTPAIEKYENAINALCEAYGNVDEEAFNMLVEDFEIAEEGLGLFASYDNMPTELQQRVQTAEAKLQDLVNAMNAVAQ